MCSSRRQSLDADATFRQRPDNRLKAIFRTAKYLDALFRFALGAQADALFGSCARALVWIGARIDRAAFGTDVVVWRLRHGSIAIPEF
jgi:hypothetical protein